MRLVSLRSLMAVGLVSLLLGVGGCGGGGGGGDTVNGPGLPPPAGTVTGRLTFVRGSDPLVVEQEPNDDFGAAQILGDRLPGQSVTLVGALDADAAGDVFDAFRIRLPVRCRVTATLRFGVLNDFDLGVYDPTGMQFVEVFDVPTPPESNVLDLQGTVDFVITANSGQGSYELELLIEVSPGATEAEPNDTSATANYLGSLAVGGGFLVSGTADETTDPVDALLIACPEALSLGLTLQHPSFRNFDLRVSDVTTDIGAPVLLQEFTSVIGPPETGALSVSAGTLLLIEVRAVDGGGLWNLSLAAAAPPTPLVAPQALTLVNQRGLAPLALEADSLAHGFEDRHYGQVDDNVAPGEALVCFHPGEAERGAAHLARGGAEIVAELPGIACKVDLNLPAGLTDADRRRLTVSRTCAAACSACVRYSEPNRIRRAMLAPDDTYYGLQWHYDMLNLEAAWDITTGAAEIIVAVIDTGRIPHVDLDSRYIAGYDTVSLPSITGDGDGPDGDPTDLGVQTGYHGTHVAGTIGAETNDGEGVAGVTWATSLMPLRALGNYGAGTDFDIAAAILWAAKQPNSTGTLPADAAHVINMSLGGPNFNQTLADACATARASGVTIIASAGNSNSSQLLYPASYPGVISVSAVDAQRARAPYSSFGTQVDVAAPGGNTGVDTTGDGYPDGVLSTVSGGYTFYQGTSMAAPHVAGVAALLLAVNDTLTPDQIENILTSTAVDLGATGRDDIYGHGLIDAFAALSSIAAPPGGPPPPPNLLATPQTLNFGASKNELEVTVRNVGGSPLTVTGVDVIQTDGETWLAAQTFGTGDASRNVDGVRVFVDRAGLPSGSYFARLLIRSDGGDREIAVAMQKTVSTPPPPDLDIHIFAVSIETGAIVGEVVVNPAVSLEFIFGGLVAGEYLFVAATDVDDDGVFDEPGEWKGAFPILGDPLPVLVIPNITTTQVNFDVALEQLLGGLAASALAR
ncbi:MAG: S8 family serine peptidase [Planctomycetota bacterium]|nr:S8 family serine peptidase [Planctomycetota bacterium]